MRECIFLLYNKIYKYKKAIYDILHTYHYMLWSVLFLGHFRRVRAGEKKEATALDASAL
jgi:hypothetical protein